MDVDEKGEGLKHEQQRKLEAMASAPSYQYWLTSTPVHSLCLQCSDRLRAAEMGLTSPPHLHADRESEFYEGIDGGPDYSAMEEEPVYCEECGALLHYNLYSWAVENEVVEMEKMVFCSIPEIAYQILKLLSAAPDEINGRVEDLAEKFLSSNPLQ
jgi:hypothetical protein